jgi:TIR domain
MQQTQDSNVPIRIFYSYAHEDKRYQQRIKQQLGLLKNQGLITQFSNQDILPGQEWKNEINKKIETADIILLLVSPAFLDSEYCYTEEMQSAFQRYEAREARIIPIIIRPCEWRQSPLGKFQPLPGKGLPVNDWKPQDKAYHEIEIGIRKIINDVRRKKSRKPATLNVEVSIQQGPILKPLPKRKNTAFKEVFLDMAYDVVGILPDIARSMDSNFSVQEIGNRAEGFSFILLLSFTVIDTIILSILFYNWLNLSFIIPFIVLSLLFLIGITNKNNLIAYFVTSIFTFIWIFIGLNYIIKYRYLPSNSFYFVLILIAFLQLMLFRRHKNRRRRRYR